MPKLYFRYGAMNSSKTANLLMVAHNYNSHGKKTLIMKPSIDDRFGENIVASRAIGDNKQVNFIFNPKTTYTDLNNYIQNLDEKVYCILVDEAQFLSEQNVEALRRITSISPVICYGLRTDYRSRLFPGSKRLLELADSIEEIKTVCILCNRKAILNAKFHDDIESGKRIILRTGSDKPDLGMENKYQAMCWKCWSDY